MEDKLQSAAELPYFEGDFWPNVLEESIKELDQEEEEKRRQAEAAEAASAAANNVSLASKIFLNFFRLWWEILMKFAIKFFYKFIKILKTIPEKSANITEN